MTLAKDVSKKLGDDMASGVGGRLEPLRRHALKTLRGNQFGLALAFCAVFVYLSITQSIFATWGNMTNIVSSNSDVLVLALGATFVILIGQIDLSATAVAAAAGVVTAVAIKSVGLGWLALVLGLASGAAIGLVNGVLISYLRISFLVVTLGVMSILSSYALLATHGYTLSVYGRSAYDPLDEFVNQKVGPFSVLLIVDIFLILLSVAVLRYTRFGRSVYAVGSNSEAARLGGMNVAAVTTCVYIVAGLSAGIAGLIQMGRLTGASPSVDMTELMTIVAAVLIGGTSYSGGSGGIGGTVLGVAFLAVLQNGVTLSQVSASWQGAINGSILILAVGVGTLRGRWINSRGSRKVEWERLVRNFGSRRT